MWRHHQLINSLCRTGDVSTGFVFHDVAINPPSEADAEPGSNQAEAPAVRESRYSMCRSMQGNEHMSAKTSDPTLLGPAESSCGLLLLL